MSILAPVFAVTVLAWSACASELALLEARYGPADLVTISGNGRLTVGMNDRGTVNVCRWPRPSHYDQLSYRTISRDLPRMGVASNNGLKWGVRLGSEVIWLDDERWDVSQRYDRANRAAMVTEGILCGTSVRVRQTAFVEPDTDTFIVHLEVEGVEVTPVLYWYANFTPTTRRLPELPIADWMLDSLNDFAVYVDSETPAVVHFRPKDPGQDEWAKVEGRLSLEQWRSFDEGVWIGFGSHQGIARVYCDSGDISPVEAVAAMNTDHAGRRSASGQCYSLIEVRPERDGETYSATISVGFGRTQKAMNSVLSGALSRDYRSKVQAHKSHWERRLAQMATLDASCPDSVRSGIERCLITLFASTDRASGAVIRSPATQPPLARDWPVHGAWVTRAFDLAGYPRFAQDHLRFYLEHAREDVVRAKPRGSLPSAMYTDGVEAAPHLVLDTDAVAWTLWSVLEHATLLPSNRRANYLESVWARVVPMTDFLASWTDARTGAPLPSYDPRVGHDAYRDELLFTTRLGLDSAMQIAAILSLETPAQWTRRLSELDVLIRNLLLVEGLAWTDGASLPFTLGALLSAADPRLERVTEGRLASLHELEGFAVAEVLGELALLWREDPHRLDAIKPYMAEAVAAALEHNHPQTEAGPGLPDTATAARILVAAFIVYAAEEN